MKISKQILLITPILFMIFAFGCSKSLMERDKAETDSGLGMESDLEGIEEKLGGVDSSSGLAEKSGPGQKLGTAEQGMPVDGLPGEGGEAGPAPDSGVFREGNVGEYEKPGPGQKFGTAEQGMPGDGSTGSFSAEPFAGERAKAGDGLPGEGGDAGPEPGSGFFREENVGERDAFSGGYEKPDSPRDFGSAEQGMPGNGSTGSFSAEPFAGDRADAGSGLPGEGGDQDKTPEPFLAEKGEDMVIPLPRDEEVRRLLPYHPSDRLEDIHFAFDRYDLDDKSRAILQENAAYLKSHLGAKIEIQGHCDERGSNNYNTSLGQRRARSTKSYLVSLGVNESRIRTISYGEERPFCFESNEKCWYQNRRSHFLVAE